MKIVRIGDGSTAHPSADDIGAKAANLAHMAALGLPVPPAFVLPVKLCAAIVRDEPDARQKLSDGLSEGIDFLERTTGRRLGDRRKPLLVSVRSGAARSMPGMLDTVLDVGCTPAAVHGLVRLTGHPRFAWDCRRRFLESYGGVVLGVDDAAFARGLAALVGAERAESEHALDGEAVERLAGTFRQVVEDDGDSVPENPREQVEEAAKAVYRSWTSERAVTYRRLQHLDDLAGTAVTVQAMVFGNRGQTSGAGVAFSRDPSTGANEPVIDVLFESQGEDVVSGSRTPETEAAIARVLPDVAAQLRETLARLELEFRDVQDVEFTIEDGTLWILQTRAAKRTPQAALRFAIDFVKEGLITPEEALKRVGDVDLDA
ncbi:MAG: PEP/pyruvate-binding domain-containing protein, partial [Candidatus Eiseniibacteriota bacterium]